ncbi:MAG: hypothetical protein WCP55_02035 [Lentisphaerota bacterium]
MSTKYIEISLETEQGHANSCWVPTCASLDVINDALGIVIAGYKDHAANLAGKSIGENKGASIDLTTLPAWADLKSQIMNFLITDASSPLVGGVIKDL